MVKNKSLLFIASIVWLIAGFNILRIGVLSYMQHFKVFDLLLSSSIFVIFWFMVFSKLVSKHTYRIKNYDEPKQYFWNFFDIKSFVIMVFMMTSGILIRSFNLLPEVIIKIFYTGLGAALFLAGIKFMLTYFYEKI